MVRLAAAVVRPAAAVVRPAAAVVRPSAAVVRPAVEVVRPAAAVVRPAVEVVLHHLHPRSRLVSDSPTKVVEILLGTRYQMMYRFLEKAFKS